MNPSASARPSREDTLDPALADLIDRLTERIQAGEPVDLQACVRDHPQFAEQLRALLPALQALAEVGRSVQGQYSALATGETTGTVLGDYQIVRPVGRGGMGVVYEAVQGSLGRRVALKVLPSALTLDPRQLARFHNEARAAASLDHPHIVKVHSVGSDHGAHFFAMQLIDGQSLEALIRSQRGQEDTVA